MWKRGTPLSSARTLLEGKESDVSISPVAVQSGSRRWLFINRGKTFWTNEYHLLTPSGRLERVPMPEDAGFEDVLGSHLIVKLQSPLQAGTSRYTAGSLLAWPLDRIAAGQSAAPQLVMAPTARQAIEQVSASDNILWVKALEDVSGKLFALTPNAPRAAGRIRGRTLARWTSREIQLAPNSTVQLLAAGGSPTWPSRPSNRC